MRLEFGLTDEFTNTQFAPVMALAAFYQAQNVLTPLQSVTSEQKKGDFTLDDKLTQLLLSFLTGADSRFASWGLKRLVRDLLAIPGRVYFEGRQLKRIELLASHQYADELIICLERYCSGHFGNRNGLCLHELCQP